MGAILQVLGDEEHHLAAQPLDCVWQASDDGATWRDLVDTKQLSERRMYRIHRLPTAERARYFRLLVNSASGQAPAIREIEFYRDPQQSIEFPDWVLAVSSYERPDLSTCHRYLDLARKCEGYSKLLAQYLWHAELSLAMVTAEPRPVCVFYTGNHRDWCEIDPRTWRGTLDLLNDGSTPLWAACGGAQGFGLLAENGCEGDWDCPNCRDSQNPKSPIYGHIGLLDANVKTACGIYTNNIYERGPTTVRKLVDDPVFAGLAEEFLIPEYHCGQIEFLPKGWELLVTKGTSGKTWMQCMRKRGTCIYAAQFHIELQGTPENSQRIMSQYLAYAKAWARNNWRPEQKRVR